MTDHQQVRDQIQPNPYQRKVALSTCQIKAASDGIKHDLTELGDTFKYITCDTCDINAICIHGFDIYNTDGDCLMK